MYDNSCDSLHGGHSGHCLYLNNHDLFNNEINSVTNLSRVTQVRYREAQLPVSVLVGCFAFSASKAFHQIKGPPIA